MRLRSPLGRVTGLGSAKEGAGHWWSQRVSSVALALLTVWFACSLLLLPAFDYERLIAWIASPANAVLLLLLVAVTAYHSQLGIQVIVEDYIAAKGLKAITMMIVTFVHFILAALGIFSVLRVALGSGA